MRKIVGVITLIIFGFIFMSMPLWALQVIFVLCIASVTVGAKYYGNAEVFRSGIGVLALVLCLQVLVPVTKALLVEGMQRVEAGVETIISEDSGVGKSVK